MLSSKTCTHKFGTPSPTIAFESKWLVSWDVPADINGIIPALPNRIYCHKLMPTHLEASFRMIIARGLEDQLKTWDGCFNIRNKRGQSTLSIHCWALAIDINRAWNEFGAKPTMSLALVDCFTSNGFDWGGPWKKPDGMHFQLQERFVL